MPKNIRIRTIPNGGDNQIKVKLEQDFDFLEILSLKISQENIYKNFYSDYGVVIGRVSINNGVGIPNAKVSIFIPLTKDDSLDQEITSIYPYSDISIVNSDGVKYNLLPDESQGECHTPVGTFPSKNKLIDNEPLLNVYNKYYKFATTTNSSGDFMIFGVPVGNHILNVDVDLSDIGIYSQRPYDLIDQGNPLKLFESPTKFKGGKNLNNLTQLKNRQIGVNVIPFWGNKINNEIGITRIDVDLNYNVTPKAIFIGSIFGDNEKNSINKNCRPRKKIGKVCEMSEGGGTIEMLRKNIFGDNETFDIEGGRLINDNGSWAYQIPMNLDYMVSDEFGNLIPSEDTSKGIPTRAKLRFRIDSDITGGKDSIRRRAKYLVPNNPNSGDNVDYSFDKTTKDSSFRNFYWNKIYTIKNFIGRFQKNKSINNRNFVGFKDIDDCVGTKNPLPFNSIDTDFNPLYFILCLIITIIINVIELINNILAVGLLIVRLCKHISCIGIRCNNIKYTPGCWHRKCKGKGVDKASEAKKCFELTLAESLNVFEFDFTNDWINGSLYSFLLKYKKKGLDEKFCGSGNGDSGNYLINANVKTIDGTKNGNRGLPINEGTIISKNGQLYYKSITNNNNLMYATDIYNLGSVFNCDWQGIQNFHDSIIQSTYKMPDLTKDIGSTDVTIDPLLFKISCLKIKTNDTQLSNIRRLSEIGIDLEDNNNKIIDSGDIGNKLLRNNLINLNNKISFNKEVIDIDSSFEGNDYKTYRSINTLNNFTQPFGNSFYFYFGTKPNNGALELMNSKYFTICNKSLSSNIRINGVVSDVTFVNGNDGSISLTINGGSPPYLFEWYLDNNKISTDSNITNLVKGIYTIIITDSDGDSISKQFNLRGVDLLQASITKRDSLPDINGDGIIYVNTISGGIGPYNVTINGIGGPYIYNGVYNNIKLENLLNGTYSVTVTDEISNKINKNIEIFEIPKLLVDTKIIDTTISGTTDGEILVLITGGTPNYAITLISENGIIYTNINNTGLVGGKYTLSVSDSYNQSVLNINLIVK